jgi:hypothetical protein
MEDKQLSAEIKQLSESMEQIHFVNWMRKNHPQHRIFHIPNGGARGIATAHRLKMEGVAKGIPDLFIPSLLLWIEMKADGGVLSKEQKDWIEYLRSVGYTAESAWGCDAAIEIVKKRLSQG